ncbi:MAG: aspartate/glutamate racemase family protein [Pseudomonadota bacterium]
MHAPILVINPNSNAAVTAAIKTALSPLALPGAPVFDCLTLAAGPFGIESARDGAMVAPLLADLVASRPDAAAVVIACFSDPGLAACREVTKAPVIGIGEAAMMTALARADRVGVIALSEASIARHLAAWRRLAISDRVVGEEAVESSVAESGGAAILPKLEAAGRRLIADGAGAIILGCAGMAAQRSALATTLGVPVIDPVQAAGGLALNVVLCDPTAPRERNRLLADRGVV